MRKYEAFFILDPDMSDEATASANEKIMGVVTANGGAVISNTSWGKKKLAYPVRKHTRGHYILMEFSGDPTLVAELERNMRLDERVLKFITVKLLDFYDPSKEEPVEPRPAPRFGDEEESAEKAASVAEEEEEAFGEDAEGDAEEGDEEESD
ncbi:MAG: 30S ribosomal protein S6 [Syntrophobacteraceae bacterium]|jgi:small subunit ribosomal protein S6